MLEKSLLENWLNEHYFNAEHDLGSSGVESFSFEEFSKIVNFSFSDLNNIVFSDTERFGDFKLRTLISQRFGNSNPETVLIGHGSNEIINIVMNSLLQKDDEVIILYPIYYALENIVKSIGCKIKYWKLDSHCNFYPNLDDLIKLISNKTRMIIVNFPHNPTGATLNRDQFNNFVKIVENSGSYLVWDAAFEDLVYDEEPLPNPYMLYEKTIYINTLSKSYGFSGLRLGWCITNHVILDKLSILKDYTSLFLCPITELIGMKIINNLDKFLNRRLFEAKSNLEYLKTWMEMHNKYLQYQEPMGGVSTFIKIVSLDDTRNFCEEIMNQEKVLLVPGRCFGYPNFIRLGFGCSAPVFRTGLNKISRFIKNKSLEFS